MSAPPPRGRAAVFGLTWIAYATCYLGRKGFSVVKARIETTQSIGAGTLATIDTLYLAAYAAGLFGSGWMGDRVGARRLLGTGMLLAAIACAAFGAMGTAGLFMLAFTVNGLAQSTGWPGTNKAMAAWFSRSERGRVMGFWATCYQAGGIFATALASRLLAGYGWRSVFFVPSLLIAMVGALILVALVDAPPAVRGEGAPPASPSSDAAERHAAQKRVLRNPSVWCYSACYFCLKLLRYSLLFWLPYYLHKVVGLDEVRAGYLSISFETGGIVGSVVIGTLSDKYLRELRIPRSAFAVGALLALAVALFVQARFAPRDPLAVAVLLAVIGFLLFGPDSLICGAAAQDAGGQHATALAAGVVNGVGSLGAILQGWVTYGISHRWGWNMLYYFFVGLVLVGAICLTPTLWQGPRSDPAR